MKRKVYRVVIEGDGPQPVDLATMLRAKGLNAEVTELPDLMSEASKHDAEKSDERGEQTERADDDNDREKTEKKAVGVHERLDNKPPPGEELSHQELLETMAGLPGTWAPTNMIGIERGEELRARGLIEGYAFGYRLTDAGKRASAGDTDPPMFVNREQLLLSMRHARGHWVKADHVPKWLAEALLAEALIESAPHPGGVRWSGYRLTTKGMLCSADVDPTSAIGPPGS